MIGRRRNRLASTAASRVRLALVLQLAGELDDQDGVLGRQPRQHQKADLHEDVHRHVDDQHSRDRTQDAHRHDEDDRQRQRPRLVLGCQHQEDQHRRQQEHEDGRAALLLLQVGDLGPLGAHVGLFRRRLHGPKRLARGDPRRGGAVDRRRGVHVVAHHHDRAGDRPHRRHGPQRHHTSQRVAHLEHLQVTLVGAILLVGREVDLPGAAELVEQVDVVGAHVHLQGVEGVLHVHAQLLTLSAVDVHIELGSLGAVDREQADQLRGLRHRLGGLAAPRRSPGWSISAARPDRRSRAARPGV